jgi:hypothetical protein
MLSNKNNKESINSSNQTNKQENYETITKKRCRNSNSKKNNNNTFEKSKKSTFKQMKNKGKWNRDEIIDFYTCSSLHIKFGIAFENLKNQIYSSLTKRSISQIKNKFSLNKKVPLISDDFWKTHQNYIEKVEDNISGNSYKNKTIERSCYEELRKLMIELLTEKEIIEKSYCFVLSKENIINCLAPILKDSGEDISRFFNINNICIEMNEEMFQAMEHVNNKQSNKCMLFNNDIALDVIEYLYKKREEEVNDLIEDQ